MCLLQINIFIPRSDKSWLELHTVFLRPQSQAYMHACAGLARTLTQTHKQTKGAISLNMEFTETEYLCSFALYLCRAGIFPGHPKKDQKAL